MEVSRPQALQAAKINHEVNNAMKDFLRQPVGKPFEKLTEEEKHVVVTSATKIMEKPDATPADVHDMWMESMLARGWRHGEVKDDSAKTHPSIVPYEQLDDAEKMKDVIFLAIVKAVALG